MLGHMQKVSHFLLQMKKNTKCQLGRFCPEPFNCLFHNIEIINFYQILFSSNPLIAYRHAFQWHHLCHLHASTRLWSMFMINANCLAEIA